MENQALKERVLDGIVAVASMRGDGPKAREKVNPVFLDDVARVVATVEAYAGEADGEVMLHSIIDLMESATQHAFEAGMDRGEVLATVRMLNDVAGQACNDPACPVHGKGQN